MGCAAGQHSQDDGHSDVDMQQQDDKNHGKTGKEKIFLANPRGFGDAVYFDAKLMYSEGSYILTDVTTGGLAYQAGLRDGDQLIGIYAKNIEKYSLRYILQYLREEVEKILLLEFKRSHGGCTKYIWSRFELTFQEGVPAIIDVQIVETDNDVIPDSMLKDAIYWGGAPIPGCEIYVESKDQTLYLGIDKGKLQFMTYDKNKCTFYGYRYISSIPPSQGNIVAYSQENFDPSKPSDKNTPAATGKKDKPQLDLLDFPSSMVTQTKFPSNDRLWFQTLSTGSAPAFNLESATHKGWYLSRDPKDNSAYLTKKSTATDLQIKALPYTLK
ncbi:uncharacterized protein LOC119719369 [Patiria miniata]|uniref:PDZ domain-containing protein n=1 Tax=Patiria miniata TaxID=46514 RepID=A0A913Z213_PATMI|nr:uncharacterized protein LOC119719369 [Patiria miniata]XP_038044726.1 uncharacterized protein LOC119719369 [Patiria miniata]